MNTLPSAFPIDSSAILYLAQMGPDHTNVYRFTATLSGPIQEPLLQQAADRVFSRFPTIFAGFRPGPFSYTVVPASQPPQVREDPGLLHTMTPEEIRSCACRIYHSGCHIIFEAFHALTDGFGALAALRALLAEYVYLRHGVCVPERKNLLESPPDWEKELRDIYPDCIGGKAGSLPVQRAYQLPRKTKSSQVYAAAEQVSTLSLRQAARRSGVSVTTLLSGLMAEAIMELQHSSTASQSKKPVRIMVPVDLRRQFPSSTFRNFILYALPSLRPEDARLPRTERLKLFQNQLRRHTDRELIKAQITRNVKIQQHFLFRCLPTAWKCTLMRLSYRFFGECNSSITLTNLGPVSLSEDLGAHVERIQVYLMPRRVSPCNCGLLSCGDNTCITITRFGPHAELEDRFFAKLHQVLNGE